MPSVNTFQLKVDAGRHERINCPVSYNLHQAEADLLGGPGPVAMKDEAGREIPAQIRRGPKGYVLHFIIDRLQAGTDKTFTVAPGTGDSARGTVKLAEENGRLQVTINGEYFTTYVYDRSVAKPYLGPIAGPYGKSYTRLDFETKEHPHHRSLWLAIGDVNGIDMWNEPEGRYGKQLHQQFEELTSGPACVVFTARNVWASFNEKPQIDETRTITIYNTPANGRIVDVEVVFEANYGQVEFGATKEAGPLGIRVAESMKAANGGTIINSYGSVGEEECWGQKAEWCDYYGPVDGHTLGIAAFDHPQNEHYPTYWHIRNYGLHAANNFYFVGGKLLKPGDKAFFRYRVFFHEGDTNQAKVADRYQDYIHPPKAEKV